MTPLAQRVARELTLPISQRTFDDQGGVIPLLDQEMHCFEVSAISGAVNEAMDLDNLWPDIESMLPNAFLPSPVTWLEMVHEGVRIACVLQETCGVFRLRTVHDRTAAPAFSIGLCEFRARGAIEAGGKIEVMPFIRHRKDISLNTPASAPEAEMIDPWKLLATVPLAERERIARPLLEMMQSKHAYLDGQIGAIRIEADLIDDEARGARRFVGMCILMLDLINTPGLIGLRQHDPHRALARQLQRLGVGSYPLRGWSEVTVKTTTELAKNGERVTGSTFHKCLHFVRAHIRHYRDGTETLIPAHWRGDPALGIKRTRYRVAPTLPAEIATLDRKVMGLSADLTTGETR